MSDKYEYRKIPNWRKLRKRYCAFWNKEVEDSMFIAQIQNPDPDPPKPKPWMLEESEDKYLNPEKFYELLSWRRTAWNWHTDLFQYKNPSYGPNVFAGFCGAKVVFGRDTVWHEPVISSLDEADRIHFDEGNRYWKAHLETIGYFVERCAGDEQIGITDFGGPADWISVLMGAENFFVETIKKPDKMRKFAMRLANEYNQAYDIVYPLVTTKNDGIVNWMPVWSECRMSTIQDDMTINFSPEMYKDVFVPALRIMAAHTDCTVLHWHDGCTHHLDSLLKLDEINLIQYGHDPNSPRFRDEINTMQKIQSAGKCLFISCVQACDVEFFVNNLDPHGLMMIINTANDNESEQMEENCRRWTKKRLNLLELKKKKQRKIVGTKITKFYAFNVMRRKA